jgi:hypothetical protein
MLVTMAVPLACAGSPLALRTIGIEKTPMAASEPPASSPAQGRQQCDPAAFFGTPTARAQARYRRGLTQRISSSAILFFRSNDMLLR